MKEQIGRTFHFDYGGLALKVHYLSESELRWQQVQGPDVGLQGNESYRFVAVRPQVYFIWWQEHDTSVVTQVVDFEEGRVYTIWTSPEKKVEHFRGTVTG